MSELDANCRIICASCLLSASVSTHIPRTRALTNVPLTSASSQQRQLMEFFTLLHDSVPMASKIGGYLANPAKQGLLSLFLGSFPCLRFRNLLDTRSCSFGCHFALSPNPLKQGSAKSIPLAKSDPSPLNRKVYKTCSSMYCLWLLLYQKGQACVVGVETA